MGTRKFSGVISFITVCSSVVITIVTGQTPYVSWSMDQHSGTDLQAQYNENEEWTGQLQSLLVYYNESQIFQPGVVGNAIYIDGKQLQVTRNLSVEECVVDPGRCLRGLTLRFWIKVQSWKKNCYQTILRTSSTRHNTPGIYIGRGTENDFVLQIQTSTGILSNASIPDKMITQVWAHITVAWNASDHRLQIYVNKSSLSSNQYIQTPRTTRVRVKNISSTSNLVMGNPIGPKFYVDELEIFYDMISSDNTSPPPGGYDVLLLAVLLPTVIVVLFIASVIVITRKKRTKNSLRNYSRQTSVPVARGEQRHHSDSGDDDTEIDTDVETERLHNRLLQRDI